MFITGRKFSYCAALLAAASFMPLSRAQETISLGGVSGRVDRRCRAKRLMVSTVC